MHDRVESLHEKDEDSQVRLHNSYVSSAEAGSERDGLRRELERERAKRYQQQQRLEGGIIRIRAEREGYKDEVASLKKEIEALNAKDPEWTAAMWAAEAN